MQPAGAVVTSDAVIYLPGIMGSELVDDSGSVVWGIKMRLLARQLVFRDVLARLVPRPGDGIRASQPVRFPVTLPGLSSIDPYGNLERRLRQVVVRPEAVLAFAYDWRHSIAAAAAALAPVARHHLATWRDRFARLPDDERRGLANPMLILVGHSMGGLVASWFATQQRDAGGEDVRLVITLGTPFAGSLNAVRVLATGQQLPLGLFASALGEAARTMPGLYELVASYPCVDTGERSPPRPITRSDIAAIGGDADLTTAAQATISTLADAIGADGGDRFRCLAGTTQPTLQSVRFPPGGDPEFVESWVDGSGRRADYRGDGTVCVGAAVPTGLEPSPLPQSHGALAKTSEGVEFAAAKATWRTHGPPQAGGIVGLRVPDLVGPGERVVVEALDAELGAMCLVHDAETNVQLAMTAFAKVDDRLQAAIELPEPGLYRVSLAAGGSSPVERLVLAVEPE